MQRQIFKVDFLSLCQSGDRTSWSSATYFLLAWGLCHDAFLEGCSTIKLSFLCNIGEAEAQMAKFVNFSQEILGSVSAPADPSSLQLAEKEALI